MPVQAALRLGRHASESILETPDEWRANLLVLGWRGRTQSEHRAMGATLDPVMRRAPCDVAVLKAAAPLPGVGAVGPAPISVLCPTTGSKHGMLAMDLAAGLTALVGGHTHYIHVMAPEASPMPGVVTMQRAGLDVALLHNPDLQGTVLEQAQSHGLLVLGAARGWLLPQLLFGTAAEAIARATTRPVLLVKRHPGNATSAAPPERVCVTRLTLVTSSRHEEPHRRWTAP